MFDFDTNDELSFYAEDIYIINGKVPSEEITNNIILITNVQEEELNDFLGKNTGKIFVFSEEDSLYKFEELLLKSKGYLDKNFNMADLHFFISDKDNISVLKYIPDIKNITNEKMKLYFVNEENLTRDNEILSKENLIWVLKDNYDSGELEGFYIV